MIWPLSYITKEVTMRWAVVNVFNELILPFKDQIRTIAVVGGARNEPELHLFQRKTDLELFSFGIDSNTGISKFTYLDLNFPIESTLSQYDLILCSQVLEHVWDVKQALKNLVALAKPNGFIWIACPASNYAHGSPDYFSSGYQPGLIEKLLEKECVEILRSGLLGSKRYYFMTHALQVWGTKNEHKSPLTSGFSRYFFSQILGRLFSYLKSTKVVVHPKYATETYVLARKM
jgi:SAM-dependent methyltransferase